MEWRSAARKLRRQGQAENSLQQQVAHVVKLPRNERDDARRARKWTWKGSEGKGMGVDTSSGVLCQEEFAMSRFVRHSIKRAFKTWRRWQSGAGGRVIRCRNQARGGGMDLLTTISGSLMEG